MRTIRFIRRLSLLNLCLFFMAFGGDDHNVENTYGHSLMAREAVANVLIGKVRTGYMTEAEAKVVAQKILYQNAVDLFGTELYLTGGLVKPAFQGGAFSGIRLAYSLLSA